MKKIILLSVLLSHVVLGFSQITKGGIPYSLRMPISKNISTVELEKVSEQWKEEVRLEQEKTGSLELVAKNLETNLSLDNSGTWHSLPNGDRVWLLKITALDAKAVNPLFADFYLPKNAELFIYSPDYKQILGAYTEENNHESKLFSTELIFGNSMILEYYEPANERGKGSFTIDQVGSFFKDVFVGNTPLDVNESDNCQINVNCSPVGTNWQDEKRGVARILVTSPSGQGWCTGSLVNNTASDCKNYFLTALHCGEDATTANFNQWVFYFNYEFSGCTNGSTAPSSNTLTGAAFRSKANALTSTSTSSDFLLLELNSTIPSNYNVYYNGWNVASAAPTGGGVGIHHPAGDVKKISTFSATPTSVGVQWSGGGYAVTSGSTHWSFSWSANSNGHGVTEGGSSGSPMFNSAGLVVGTLSGGGSYCNALTQSDQYGKMSYHWQSNNTATNRQLKPWLDPTNSGVTSLVGTYAPCATISPNDAGITTIINPTGNVCGTSITPQVTLKNFGTANLTSVTIRYQINTGTLATYNWSGTLAPNASVNVTLNNATAPVGANTFTAYTQNPNGGTDGNAANNQSTSSFTVANTISLPLSQNFEGTTFPATGFSLANGDNSTTWAQTSTASFGTGSKSMFLDFWDYNAPGQYDWFLTPTYNFTSVTNATLTYDLAYAYYDQTNGNNFGYDSLGIAVSTDCGNTFYWLSKLGGTQLATAGGLGVEFVPTSNQWQNKSLSLSSLNGESSVQFAFIAINGYGNNMYLDNININNAVVPTPPVANFSVNDNSICVNTTASFTDLSTNTPTSWSWSFPGGTPSTSTQQNPTITYNTAGTYSVTLTATNGDGSDAETKTAYITVTAKPVVNITKTNVSCFGGNNGSATAVVTGVSPFTYVWTGSTGTGATITNLTANTYSVTVTDANGCSASNNTTITQPSIIDLIVTSNTAYCGNTNGSATVVTSGGTAPYNLTFSNGGNGTNLAPGNYSVTATDNNGCTRTQSFNIANTTQTFTINVQTTPTSCTGNTGTAVATANGSIVGYSFLWDNGQTTLSASGLSYGNHTLTMTNSNGCSNTTNFFVGNVNAPTINLTTSPVTCPGFATGSVTAQISGGTPSYTVDWSSSNNTSLTESNLAAGLYSITVTDAAQCESTANFTITQPDPFVVNFNITPEHCSKEDGQIIATANGGTPSYIYNWNNGASGNIIQNESAGTFQVTVLDQNNCSLRASATIVNIPAALLSNIVATDVSCGGANDGSIYLDVTGGNGSLSYQWSNGAMTQDLINVSGGTYTLLVNDVQNCSSDTTITLEEPDALAILLTVTDNWPNGISTITANATGGSQIYDYSWSNGATTQTITNLNVGYYTITVTDSENCSKDTTVSIGNVAIDDLDAFEQFSIYPNPVQNELIVSLLFKGQMDVTISILNTIGQKVFEKEILNTQNTIETISTQHLSKGVYYLSVETENQNKMIKFLKFD